MKPNRPGGCAQHGAPGRKRMQGRSSRAGAHLPEQRDVEAGGPRQLPLAGAPGAKGCEEAPLLGEYRHAAQGAVQHKHIVLGVGGDAGNGLKLQAGGGRAGGRAGWWAGAGGADL